MTSLKDVKLQFTSPEIERAFIEEARGGLAALLNRKDLGFWQLAERDQVWRSSQAFAKKISSKKAQLIVVGMGGSALGGRCLVQSLHSTAPIYFLNNLDPDSIHKILSDNALMKKAQFLVISKTGGTLEIACLLDLVTQRLKKLKRSLPSAISVISEDKGNPLTTWAHANKLNFLEHPQDVGGRFSAFTPVGLVPAAVAGVSLKNLRAGLRLSLSNTDLIIQIVAFYLQSFKRQEFQSVFWSYVDQLMPFSDWIIQVWSESLAKSKTKNGAQAPHVSTPIFYSGAKDQHSVLQQLMEGQEKLSLCFLRAQKFYAPAMKLTRGALEGFAYLQSYKLQDVYEAQSQSTEAALQKIGRQTASLTLPKIDAQALAQLMMTFEMVIGVLGECLNINAFDQPGVELGKKITIEKLQKSSRL